MDKEGDLEESSSASTASVKHEQTDSDASSDDRAHAQRDKPRRKRHPRGRPLSMYTAAPSSYLLLPEMPGCSMDDVRFAHSGMGYMQPCQQLDGARMQPGGDVVSYYGMSSMQQQNGSLTAPQAQMYAPPPEQHMQPPLYRAPQHPQHRHPASVQLSSLCMNAYPPPGYPDSSDRPQLLQPVPLHPQVMPQQQQQIPRQLEQRPQQVTIIAIPPAAVLRQRMEQQQQPDSNQPATSSNPLSPESSLVRDIFRPPPQSSLLPSERNWESSRTGSASQPAGSGQQGGGSLVQLLGQMGLQAGPSPHMSHQDTVSQPPPLQQHHHHQSGQPQPQREQGRAQSWQQQQLGGIQPRQQQQQRGSQLMQHQVREEGEHSTTSWPAGQVSEKMAAWESGPSHSSQVTDSSPHLPLDHEGLGAGGLMRPPQDALGAGGVMRPPLDALGAGNLMPPSPGQDSSPLMNGVCPAASCREMAEAYAGLAKLMEVKDQMIWHLLKERNELLERLASGSSNSDTTRFYEGVE